MILAIDPGGTTGVAWLSRGGVFRTQEVAGGADGMHDALHSWLEFNGEHKDPVDAVVYEDFVPRPGAKSQQLDAMHIIGAIKYLCWKHGIACIKQTPTQAKSFATSDKLKAVGWHVVGEDHGRDAARHMLVFLCNNLHAYGSPYAALKADILNRLVAS